MTTTLDLDELERSAYRRTLGGRARRFWTWWRYETMVNPLVLAREIRYFIQRGRRGWSSRDLWSFDTYLAEMLEGALTEFNKRRMGYVIFPHPDDASVEWGGKQYAANHDGDETKTDVMYREMIEGFKAALLVVNMERLDGAPFEPDYRYEAEYAVMNRGFEHFKNYFHSLWI